MEAWALWSGLGVHWGGGRAARKVLGVLLGGGARDGAGVAHQALTIAKPRALKMKAMQVHQHSRPHVLTECVVKICPGCKVSRRRCPPGTTRKHVRALSKQCPSTIQAVSKQGRFASKLGAGHIPELCVYNGIGASQLRPSTPSIILKRENSYRNLFCFMSCAL